MSIPFREAITTLFERQLNLPPENETPDWLRELTPESRHRVHVCFGKNCTPAGAHAVYAAFERALASEGISSEIELIATSCRSRCEIGPSVNVYPGPITYGYMNAERAERVVREHLNSGGHPIPAFEVTPDDLEQARKTRRLPPG